MADPLTKLLAAYSSGGSDADMEDLAQSILSGSSDNESDSNDDVVAVDDELVPKKQKTLCSELQPTA
jgi:hypothetical protein